MKDMFEEKLNRRLQELEQDASVGDMLDREAIWKRIEAGQPPVMKRSLRPRIMQLAAALICCLGIGLLIKYQQQTTTIAYTHTVATVPPIQSPAAAIAVEEEMIKKEEEPVLREKGASTARRPDETLATVPKEQVGGNNNITTPAEYKTPGVITSQAVKPQETEAPQLAVMYLSDLDKENPAVSIPQKSRESGRVARYVKSNLEEYASSLPPRVVINQILSK